MARAIDKDKLITSMAWHDQQGMISSIDDVLDIIEAFPTLTPPNEPLSPYPDGDASILACPRCGSSEYLYNEDGAWNNYCGQCGQRIGWVIMTDHRPPEGEEDNQ